MINEASLLLCTQGKEEHQEWRPLSIEKGVAALLSKQPAHGILNVSLYYSYGETSMCEMKCKMYNILASHKSFKRLELHQFIEQLMPTDLDLVKGHVVQQELTAYERIWL